MQLKVEMPACQFSLSGTLPVKSSLTRTNKLLLADMLKIAFVNSEL